jgi:DNA-binding IclR family transcriptional regulator
MLNRVSNSETQEGRAVSLNRSVSRACVLLSAFSLDEPRLTLLELSKRVDLPKPTVYRLASSLVAAGFMNQAEDGRYGLGFKLLELGAVVRENLDLVTTCLPDMRVLAERTGETVILGQVDWATREVVIVHRIDSAHSLSVLSPTGRRSSIPPGCLGKAVLMGLDRASARAVLEQLDLRGSTPRTHTDKAALLEELERCRAAGFAAEQDEYRDGVSGVAAPVVFEGGSPHGAVGVVGPTSRLHGELERIGALVRDVTESRRPPAFRSPLSSRGT